MNTIGASGSSLPVSRACVGVVEADAEDRARPRDRREQRHLGERERLAAGGLRSPEASRSSTVPDVNATTSSPRTSPAIAVPGAGWGERREPHLDE